MSIMITAAMDIIVLHEQDYRHSAIRKYLAIGVVERTVWILGKPYLSFKLRMDSDLRDGQSIFTSFTSRFIMTFGIPVPTFSVDIP